MELSQLIKTYRTIKEEIAHIDKILSAGVGGKGNVADELTRGIKSYLNQASPTLVKVLQSAKGELIVQNGRVYHRGVKTPAPLTWEGAYEYTRQAIDATNRSIRQVAAGGYDPQALRALGQALVNLYEVYDRIHELEEENNALVAQKEKEAATLRLKKAQALDRLAALVKDVEQYNVDHSPRYAQMNIADYLQDEGLVDERIPLGKSGKLDGDFADFVKQNMATPLVFDGEPLALSQDVPVCFVEADEEALADGSLYQPLERIVLGAYTHFKAKNLQVAMIEDKINRPVLQPILRNLSAGVSSSLLFCPSVAGDEASANNLIDRLFDELNDRQSRILSFRSMTTAGGSGDIYGYNAHNPANPMGFILLVYKDFPSFSQTERGRAALLKLLQEGGSVGIFTLLIGRNVEVRPRFGGDKVLPPLDLASLSAPVIKLSGGKASLNGDAFTLAGLDLNVNYLDLLKQRLDQAGKFYLDDILEEEKDVPYWERIKIPIGESDGRTLYYESSTEGSPAPFSIVTGSTGSGKSSLVHSLILSAAYKYSPQEVEIHLVDFKSADSSTDFDGYRYVPGVDNLFVPHVKYVSLKSRPENAVDVTNYVIKLIAERARYKKFASHNATCDPKDRIPQIFVIIDEYENMLRGGDGGTAGSVETLNLINQIKSNLTSILKRARVFGIGVIFAGQDFSLDSKAANQINMRYAFVNGDNTLRACFPSAMGGFDRFPSDTRLAKGYCYFGMGKDPSPSFGRIAFAGGVDSERQHALACRIREKYPEDTRKHIQTVIGGSGYVVPQADSYKDWQGEIADRIAIEKMAYDSDEDFYSSGAEDSVRLMRPLAIGQSASSRAVIGVDYTKDSDKYGYYAFASRQGLTRLETNLSLAFLKQTADKSYKDKRVVLLDASFDGIKEQVIDRIAEEHPFVADQFEYVRGSMAIATKLIQLSRALSDRDPNPRLVILHGLDFLDKDAAKTWLKFEEPKPTAASQPSAAQSAFGQQREALQARSGATTSSLLAGFMAGIQPSAPSPAKSEPAPVDKFAYADVIAALKKIYLQGSRVGLFVLVGSESYPDIKKYLLDNMADVRDILPDYSIYGSFHMFKSKMKDSVPNANVAYVLNNASGSTVRLYNYLAEGAKDWWKALEKHYQR